MDTPRETLLDWLRDAHAMEEQAVKMLDSTADRLENYPELKARLLAHRDESREQVRLVAECLDALGADSSTMKDLAGKTVAMFQGMSGMFVSDEVVKATMAVYTFKHMEIAAYRSLMAAADAVGAPEVRRLCDTILPQEEAMADWLKEKIPMITQQFIGREQSGTTAKH
jgi:ferritin-like metal-binding protein YciE